LHLERVSIHWRTTTYEDSDAFGILGGRDRVEAAAVLAKISMRILSRLHIVSTHYAKSRTGVRREFPHLA
jgi:hypothetical protein